MSPELNTVEKLAGLSLCRQFGHAPPEVEYNPILNWTRITCTRCRKTVYEKDLT